MDKFDFLQSESELIAIIEDYGVDRELNVEDLDIRWTIWDDDDDIRNDEDGEVRQVVKLTIDFDCNGCVTVMVCWDDDDWNSLGSLNYDDNGYNCAEYIMDEVLGAY